jgi:dienelactone hydrolase
LVTLDLTRYERVRGALLTPHGPGPFPAVLLLHDHGAKFDIGKEKLVRPWYDDTRLASAQGWADRYFSGRFVGDELARRGYVVLALDALGWADRGPLAYDQQQALASNLYNLGSSLAGLMAREDVRAAGFLAGLDRVDRRRVAAVGFSMGAYRAWQTAALSDDIAAAASVCWMTGLKEMMVPGNNTLRGQSSYYMLHPGLARHRGPPRRTMPGARGLARTSAALSSIADSPTLDCARPGGPPSRRRPPPPCSCTHQTPLACVFEAPLPGAGLVRRAGPDFPDVASIAAPRPMLFFHGAQDPLFPAEGVRVAHEKLRAVWRSRRAGERLHTRIWPDLGHVFTAPMQDDVFSWLDAVL